MIRHYVYILRCKDQSLYTGYTNNPEKRLKVHQSGKGSKYIRSRLPITCVFLESFPDKSQALKKEIAIKNMSKTEKEKLVAAYAKPVRVGEHTESNGS